VIAGRSEDGVVEALEMARPGGAFRVLLVQWHPERMDAGGSPLSGGIRKLFFQSFTTT
jgi:gamma-glutamyl-gamma-aminobutyrate hydrolase PuuD